MRQLRLSTARNVGNVALNHANEPARAFMTAGRSAGGRIGKIFSISSSSAYRRDISFRNASPRFGPITARNAEIAIRRLTASADGGGKRSWSVSVCRASGITTVALAKCEPEVNKRGHLRVPRVAYQESPVRYPVTPDWAQTQIGEAA